MLLAAGVEASEDAKYAIFELAGVLCEGLHDGRCVVRVRFSSGRPESGIMPSVGSPLEFDHDAYKPSLASAAEIDALIARAAAYRRVELRNDSKHQAIVGDSAVLEPRRPSCFASHRLPPERWWAL
ncbi:MAG: hypothetical protein QM756_27640 [Polyangiaceae bacterium]